MLELIASPVAWVLRAIHTGLSTFLIDGSGPAWGLSIVLLVVFVRLLLFPLFVKQIKSQRRMQQLAPQIKELQKRHKGDRQTLNTEMMKLYKDNNANPISGCLPLLLQLPVFFALFTVLREFKPSANVEKYGLPVELLQEGGRAQIFGAPIAAALNSPSSLIEQLGGTPGVVRVVAVVMLVLMGATTFITQRQMMARATVTDPTQMQVQKVLLYVLPLSFAVFGFSFPLGVLLYWLTTNIWSMGQQAYVIKKMPPPDLSAVSGRGGSRVLPAAVSGGKGGAKNAGGGKAGAVDLGKSGAGKGKGSRGGAGTVQLGEEVDLGAPSAGVGAAAGASRSGAGSRQVAGSGSSRSGDGRPAGSRPSGGARQGSRKQTPRKKGRPGGRH